MGSKKRRGHRLYALTVIILGIAIIIMSIIVFFYVQKIEVEGNEYTKNADVVALVQDDPASANSLYILGKYLLKRYDMPACFESTQIRLTAPWAVKVTVKEKPVVGFVYDAEGYVYFDKDGLVVCKGRDVIEGIPQLEGVEVKKSELYKKLECTDDKLFASALELMQDMKLYELTPSRIVCDQGQLYLYFGEVCVALGNVITTEKVAQIKPIVEKLEGQSGTLHLEFYENESSTVTFNQGEFPGQEVAEEVVEEEAAEAVEETSDDSYEEDYTEEYTEDYDEEYEEDYQ